jgi:hypothetical protein
MTRRKAIAGATISTLAVATAVRLYRPHRMQPSDSKDRFERFINESGSSLAGLTAADASRLMLAFYRQVRAADCPLDERGDMLLFQWGVHDFGEGNTFHYDITRQFILSGSQSDEGMSQLSLTVHFAATGPLRALKGDRWCSTPVQTAELEEFIRSHEATCAVARLKPLKVTLDWSPS